MKRILVFAAMVAILTGCSWVELTASGEKVRILSAEEVRDCKRVGTTTVSLKAKIGAIERKRQKVQDELNILARNGAADLNGNAAVAITSPENGRQVFAVYRCE